jgi:H+/gluconate symporter-like permease
VNSKKEIKKTGFFVCLFVCLFLFLFLFFTIASEKKIYWINLTKKMKKGRAVVVHAFNPSTQEAEAGGFLSLRPTWSTE